MLWCHAAPQLFIGLTPNSTRVKFNMKATERVAQKEKRIGGFTHIFALQNVDMVNTKMLYVLTPSATWGWCLGAGTRPPTHLKNAGTPSARVTIVHGTEFWPQTFCARFLVGKGAQVHGSTRARAPARP